MALAQLHCRAQVGLAAPPVTVEVHLGAGLPNFSIVGLPAAAVRESKERVRAALLNSGFEFPAGRITVNLAPADLPKEGGRFDLAIAVGILLASGQLAARGIADLELYGELALTGELRAVPGLLPAAQAARAAGRALIAPVAGAAQLGWLGHANAGIGLAHSLLEVCGHLADGLPLSAPAAPVTASAAAGTEPPSLADVCGQLQARRALVVAAAGGHSLLLVGPPGCGKSMLARRLPALLPPLDPADALEVACIASVAGDAVAAGVAGAQRPFRAPHHTSSAGAIVGGGPRARPGEITLAHRGVLFLDELPEFDRRVLEALREPLETGSVQVSRAGLRAEYPARFQLVAAMNPCPCGYYGHAVPAARACHCPAQQRQRYRARISGPLLDRIDLRVEMRPVSETELALHREDRAARLAAAQQCSRQVARARACQQRRGRLNSALTEQELEDCAAPTPMARRVLAAAQSQLALSLRAQHRCLRVARTLADLEEADRVDAHHVAEALGLRRALDNG